MVIFDLFSNYTFYSRYNTVWIANTEIGLDSNNSVIKRLWCMYKCLNGYYRISWRFIFADFSLLQNQIARENKLLYSI